MDGVIWRRACVRRTGAVSSTAAAGVGVDSKARGMIGQVVQPLNHGPRARALRAVKVRAARYSAR